MYKERSSQISIGVLLMIIVILLACTARAFFSGSNLVGLATTISTSFIVGLGALGVMATGNIDVSAGAIYGITGVVAAQLSLSAVPGYLAILAAMAVGALLGGINALLITGLKIPSIVVTLGTSSIFTGVMILVTHGGAWIVGLPENFTMFGQGRIWGWLPVPVLFAVVAGGIVSYITTRIPFGRMIFAFGSNAEAARLAGIPVRRVEGAVFVANGALLGLAASLVVARLGQAQNNIGDTVTMAAITIAVVGGVSALGGTGRVSGIFMATLLVEVTSSALIFFHVDTTWNKAIQGGFILIALVVSVIKPSERRKWKTLFSRIDGRKAI